jgi:hypothetical protein
MATEPDIDLEEVLWITANSVLTGVTRDVQAMLAELVNSLKNEMQEIEMALGLSDASSQEQQFSRREMPLFHMNRKPLRVSTPVFTSIFGPRTLRRHAEILLRRFLPALNDALTSYAVLLRGWSQLALNGITQQFNVYADQYRAQLQRLLSGRLSSGDDLYRLKRDITLLSESSGAAVVEPDLSTRASLIIREGGRMERIG